MAFFSERNELYCCLVKILLESLDKPDSEIDAASVAELARRYVDYKSNEVRGYAR